MMLNFDFFMYEISGLLLLILFDPFKVAPIAVEKRKKLQLIGLIILMFVVLSIIVPPILNKF